MAELKATYKTREALLQELDELRAQLTEAVDTIEAIRTGQIDALVVQNNNEHQLFTLKSADQSYRVFIEKMTEGAVTLSPGGIILYSNSQFAAMIGLPLSGVMGTSFSTFVAESDVAAYNVLFTTAWQNDCKGEVVLLTAANNVPVQLSLTTLEMDEGVSLSIILTDLTAQKDTQTQLRIKNEQLEASNNDLQQFASVASHDLQEPLRKIQVYSNLLKDKETELGPQSKKYLEKVIESSGRMRTLIIEILNYSSLSANIKTEKVDLNKLLNDLKEDFELIIQEKNAIINIEQLPVIEANKGQIRQVFQNMISNALKFSKPSTQPVISIRSKRVKEKSFDSPIQENGPYCNITVSDNGIGFDEKYLDNIFALFERLNPKDKFEGTGIGMAIAKKIIDKHHGLITAKSEEGRGAEFYILLPIHQVQP